MTKFFTVALTKILADTCMVAQIKVAPWPWSLKQNTAFLTSNPRFRLTPDFEMTQKKTNNSQCT